LLINISETGVFTGTLLDGGKRSSVRGFLDQDGTAIAVVKVSKKKKELIFLARGEGNSLIAVLFGREQQWLVHRKDACRIQDSWIPGSGPSVFATRLRILHGRQRNRCCRVCC
jgi:hypothetical protein